MNFTVHIFFLVVAALLLLVTQETQWWEFVAGLSQTPSSHCHCASVSTFERYAVFVTSRRGNPMIMYRGMNFIRERTQGYRTRWVCGRKRRLHCVASVTTTLDGVLIKTYGFHNHS